MEYLIFSTTLMQRQSSLKVVSSMNTRVAGKACVFTRYVHARRVKDGQLVCYDDAAWLCEATGCIM